MAPANGIPDNVLQWGSDALAWGDDLLAWGAPLTEIRTDIPRLLPEQVIVAACRSVRLPPFAVFQEGTATIPSVIFGVSGSDELAAFERATTTQTFVVAVRDRTYKDVVLSTNALIKALRKFPESRVRSAVISGDTFADDFRFFIRSISVVIQI